MFPIGRLGPSPTVFGLEGMRRFHCAMLIFCMLVMSVWIIEIVLKPFGLLPEYLHTTFGSGGWGLFLFLPMICWVFRVRYIAIGPGGLQWCNWTYAGERFFPWNLIQECHWSPYQPNVLQVRAEKSLESIYVRPKYREGVERAILDHGKIAIAPQVKSSNTLS